MKKIILVLVLLTVTLFYAMAGGVPEPPNPAIAESDIEFIFDYDNQLPVSLDNMKIGESVTIDGFAQIVLTDVTTIDYIRNYNSGITSISGWNNTTRTDSGPEADFCILKMDLLNLNTVPVNFIENSSVVAVYDEQYQYGGWVQQYNWDNTADGSLGEDVSKNVFIDPSDQFEISPMYTGHYVFGVTLPNAVLSSDAPLRIHITINNEELTYIVRR